MWTFSALFILWKRNPPITRGFPSQKASNAELWCLLSCASEQTIEQTVAMPEMWYTTMLIVTTLYWVRRVYHVWINAILKGLLPPQLDEFTLGNLGDNFGFSNTKNNLTRLFPALFHASVYATGLCEISKRESSSANSRSYYLGIVVNIIFRRLCACVPSLSCFYYWVVLLLVANLKWI